MFSDPFVQIAFWIGVGSFSLTLVFGAHIVGLRLLRRRSWRQKKRTIEKWRPILNATIAGCELADLPVLRKREGIVFLNLWIHLHASLRGSATADLNRLGYRLECDALARDLLDGGNRAERLLAMLVLGYLKDRQAWSSLLLNAREPDSTTSFNAASVLVKIDDALALSILTSDFLRRGDWPVSRIVTLLQDARDSCEPHLVNAMAAIPPPQMLRALRIAEGLKIELPPAIHEELFNHTSIELVIAALRVVVDADLLNTVRSLASHEDWRVRLHVARTLGRVGENSDIDVLTRLLMDTQWEVRYRAAQSLVDMPSFVKADINAQLIEADDRFASDMLTHALAESAAA